MVRIDEVKPQNGQDHAGRQVQNGTQSTPHRRWLLRFTIMILAAAASLAWYRLRPPAQATPTQAKKSLAERGGAAVPVVAALARSSTVNVYINGLGVVTPIN